MFKDAYLALGSYVGGKHPLKVWHYVTEDASVDSSGYFNAKAAELAKKWGFEYWDGDRRINYGGYRYLPGRWEKVARAMADTRLAHLGQRIPRFRPRRCQEGYRQFAARSVHCVRVLPLTLSAYSSSQLSGHVGIG